MEQQADNLGPKSRGWYRFSLRTLLIAITLLSLALGFYISRVRNEQRAAEAISAASGTIIYDWQVAHSQSAQAAKPQPPGPEWLRKCLGPHWVDRIVEVRLNENVNSSKKNRFALIGPHLANLWKLRSLDLWGPERSADDFRLLGRLTQLEELLLSQRSEITPEDTAALAGAAHLRKLHLRDAKISSEALSKLAALPKLEELHLTCYYFDPSTGNQIKQYQLGDDAAEVLSRFPALRSLMVFHAQISDKGLAALCRLERLETLVISSPNVTSASFESVLKLKHLKHLGTWAWKINEANFEKLAQLPNLRSLGLVTPLTDDGVTQVSKLDQMERLMLEGDKITDACLPNLARLTKLQWLDISDTSVHKNSPAAKQLQQALPHCQINLPRTEAEEEMHRAFIRSKWSSGANANGN